MYLHVYSDPDYDPIDDIMTRLDDYKHGGEPLVNLSCDCSLTNQKPVKQKKELDDSDSEISSESESDEEGKTITKLIYIKPI